MIRSLLPADTEPLVALWTDPEVTRHIGGPRDPEKVREAIAQKLAAESEQPYELWTVTLADTAAVQIVGDCGLLAKEIDGQSEIELVYVLARQYWGRGYATEAATALRDHALNLLGIPRLVALIEPGHLASVRVAQ